LEPRRWKAFLRLTGQTVVENEDDILNEFTGFVSLLDKVGIGYSIIVNVEPSRTERLAGQTPQQSTEQRIGR
jgi:hypothetical protein